MQFDEIFPKITENEIFFRRWCALPLHVASSEGDLELVRIILKHFDEKIIYDLMNECDEHHDPIHGYTPLHMAAVGGNNFISRIFFPKIFLMQYFD